MGYNESRIICSGRFLPGVKYQEESGDGKKGRIHDKCKIQGAG